MDVVPIYGPTAERLAPPPWGTNTWVLALINLFGGGAVLLIVAFAVFLSSLSDYDGLTGLIGLVVISVVVAVPSAIAAFVIGLPARLIPPLRRWWLAHGAYTLVGALAGLVILILGLAVARAHVDADSPSLAAGSILFTGWAIFCLNTMHFVWPRRWVMADRGLDPTPGRLSRAAAPAPPARMPRPR